MTPAMASEPYWAAAPAVEYREPVPFPVKHCKPLTRVAQAHPATVQPALAQPRTVIDDGNFQHSAARASFYPDRAPLLARRYCIFQGVLYEGLQQKARDQRIERGFLDGILEP